MLLLLFCFFLLFTSSDLRVLKTGVRDFWIFFSKKWKLTHRTASTMARATAAEHRPRVRLPGAPGRATIFCRPSSPIPPTHHLRITWVHQVTINSRFLWMLTCQKKHKHNLKRIIVLQCLGARLMYKNLYYIFFPIWFSIGQMNIQWLDAFFWNGEKKTCVIIVCMFDEWGFFALISAFAFWFHALIRD